MTSVVVEQMAVYRLPVEVMMWSKILVAALICLTLNKAQALGSTRAITQYAHTAWRSRDGYFASAPFAISQATGRGRRGLILPRVIDLALSS